MIAFILILFIIFVLVAHKPSKKTQKKIKDDSFHHWYNNFHN